MMAPEILERRNNYDSKVDIFSLGCLFYEMLFGKSPFIAKSIAGLINNIKNYKF
jgi:serine/threonine protein kinase